MTLTLIVPCHNEAVLLPAVLEELTRSPRSQAPGLEIVLVENGSTDTTAAICDTAARTGLGAAIVRTVHLPAGDYGAAVRSGIDASTGEYVAVCDCDMVDVGFVEDALAALAAEQGLVAVLASKLAPGSKDSRSIYRRLGTRVFSALVRRITKSTLVDTHGNKVLRGGPVREQSRGVVHDGALYDTELLVRLERGGWRIAERATTIVETRPPRSSYLSRVPSTLTGLWRLRRTLTDT